MDNPTISVPSSPTSSTSRIHFPNALSSSLGHSRPPSPKGSLTREKDVPLLLSYEEGARLYKHLSKESKSSGLYPLPKNDKLPALILLCCHENNRRLRIFAFNPDKETRLGSGGYGEVYLGQEIFENKHLQQNVLVTIKISKINSINKQKTFYNEQELLLKQNRCRGVYVNENQSIGYLVRDYGPGKSLFNLCFKKISVNEETKTNIYERIPMDELLQKRLVTAILKAYDHLHQEYGILHKDIKPDNIMIYIDESGEITVTIIDFGSSCLIQRANKESSGIVGWWMPPETTRSPLSIRPFYSLQSDYWLMGVLCSVCLSKSVYINFINERLDLAKKTDSYMPMFEQKDLYEAMPDIFKLDTQKETSFSYHGDKLSTSWLDYIINSIHWLSHENKDQRPGCEELSRMLEKLSLYDKKEKHVTEEITSLPESIPPKNTLKKVALDLVFLTTENPETRRRYSLNSHRDTPRVNKSSSDPGRIDRLIIPNSPKEEKTNSDPGRINRLANDAIDPVKSAHDKFDLKKPSSFHTLWHPFNHNNKNKPSPGASPNHPCHESTEASADNSSQENEELWGASFYKGL